MAIELQGSVIQLPPDRFVIFALEWALWKAQHGEWEHVQQDIENLWAPLMALTEKGVKACGVRTVEAGILSATGS
jgi:hypothetical protein